VSLTFTSEEKNRYRLCYFIRNWRDTYEKNNQN